MALTLGKLLTKKLFKDCVFYAATSRLDNVIENVSILEAPGATPYISNNSLVITTLYPITDEESFRQLAVALKERTCSGLIIKLNRFIKEVPESYIKIAEEFELPLIAFHFDASFSVLFSEIFSFINEEKLKTFETQKTYKSIVKTINENQSLESIIKIFQADKLFHCLIKDIKNEKIYSTNEHLEKYYLCNDKKVDTEKYVLGSDFITSNGQKIYDILVCLKREAGGFLTVAKEMVKFALILLNDKQKNVVISERDNLYKFFTSLTKERIPSTQLINSAKFYQWDIEFPLMMIVFSIKEDGKDIINDEMIHSIKNKLIIDTKNTLRSVKHGYIDNKLVYILNYDSNLSSYKLINDLYNFCKNKYLKTKFTIAYSSSIFQSVDLPNTYSLLVENIDLASTKGYVFNIIHENNIHIINLIQKMNQKDLDVFVKTSLEKLIDYEVKNDIPLIETLYTCIECQFNYSLAAEVLNVHYNTLRYRLKLIENLGYKLQTYPNNLFNIYFALFAYLTFKTQK